MFSRTPPRPYRWLLPSSVIWRLPRDGRPRLALTFDDGPDPDVTPFILDILASQGARATFFCTGEKLSANRALHQRILGAGHSIGNHGYRHLDGWKTPTPDYLENIRRGREVTGSSLFRPPYGRLRPVQARMASRQDRIVLWSLLSGDFDESRSADECLRILRRHTSPGDIVVFHDTVRTAGTVLGLLPSYLGFLRENSYLLELMR